MINNNEILFWKVFRNKYIFNVIFSNFIYKSLQNYNRLNNIQYIINYFTNGIDIINDKIKNNSILIWNNGNEFSELDIYKTFQENQEIYKKLYNQYSNMVEPILSYSFYNLNLPAIYQYHNIFKLNKEIVNEYIEFGFDQYKNNEYRIYKLYKYLWSNN